MSRVRSNKGCVILGGGGHALSVIDCILSAGLVEGLVVLDRDPARLGSRIAGVEVIGDDALLPSLFESGFDQFIVGLGTIGVCTSRKRLFGLASSTGLRPLTIRDPTAHVSTLAFLAEGVQVLRGALVNAQADIGANAIINSGAIVEHDCRIGDHVHVASGAILAGGVSVGECTLIGAGSTVRQYVKVGKNAVVGAGAVVVADVPEGATVVGVPARVVASIRGFNAQ
ncbi:MAG: NeuD/PglB/VioB family sugar acetyltransferase [bacterium]